MKYYKQKGQAPVTSIKKGDIVFFNFDKNPDRSVAKHVGIAAEDATETSVVTIEGNTSNMCARRQYPLDYSTITGYGIPNYE